MATARAVRLIASRPPSTNLRSLVVVPGRRRLLSTSTEAGGAGDPSVHSGDPPSDDYPDRPPKFSGAEEATGGGDHGKNPSTAAATPSESTKERVPPFAMSDKLGSQELADPAGGSSFTQKRRRSSSSRPADSREEATPGGRGGGGAESEGGGQGVLPDAQAVASRGAGVRGHEEADHACHGRRQCRGQVVGRTREGGGGHGGRFAGAR
ncbi:hypothetical protein OsJ_25561 [Oryza sativa Japonica Group]|uniref:Uncharacterized protein n=1 Tax=Oryza sativa subsp. japonica TaxID=39947 RepID=A3BND2_ORYSJ|nr:hypothetical protein OsJ_25561 [Oryza sativa Japonica Group]